MKKIVFMLSLVLVLVFSSVTAFAQDSEIIVTIDSVMIDFNEDLVSMTLKEESGDVVFIRDAIKNINHVGCLNEIYEMVSSQLKSLNKNR